MNTTPVTGVIVTRGRKIVIMLQRQRPPQRRHKKLVPTIRDQHILKLMVQGLTNKAIAYSLGLKENTIKKHCHDLYIRLGVTNRVEAVLQWQEKSDYKFEFEYSGNNHQKLSKREAEVLELMAEGYSNKIIADKLELAEDTVKKRTQSIYGKLGVNSRLQAALVYRSNKLEDLSKSELER